LSVKFKVALSVILFAVIFPATALTSYGASRDTSWPIITVNGAQVDSLWETRSGGFDYLTPATDLSRSTGAEYSFFPGTGGILIKKGNHLLELFIDRKAAIINGVKTTLGQSPLSVDGVIYVPLHTVASGLGYSVSYDEKEKSFNLSSLPGPSLERQPPVKTINELLPRGSVFLETTESKKGDLDGDGKDEYSGLYRKNDGTYGVIIYSQENDGFKQLWQKEEEFPPSLMELADLNDGGGSELLVGWNLGTPIGSYLEIYSFKGGHPDLIFSGMYHRFDQGDFDADGKNEFALWQRDYGDTYSTSVFKWNGKMFAPVECLPGYYQKVVKYYQGPSQNRSAQYYLSMAHLRSGEFDMALEAAAEGLNLPQGHPSNADFHRLKGLALVGLERYSEARESLEFSLQGFPGPVWTEARFALSRCYVATGETARGRMEIIRALNEGNHWQGYQRALETIKAEMASKK